MKEPTDCISVRPDKDYDNSDTHEYVGDTHVVRDDHEKVAEHRMPVSVGYFDNEVETCEKTK